jgi:hypothetical protein
MSSMNWEESRNDLGIVKENTKLYTSFKGLVSMKEVKEVKSGCNCIQVTFNPQYRTLDVATKSEHFPFHLRGKQFTHLVKKDITVYYKDDTYEYLTFSYILKNL